MRLGPAWRPPAWRWPVGAAGPADRPFLLSNCVILCDNVHTVPRAADLNRLTGGLVDVTGTGLAAARRRWPRPARRTGLSSFQIVGYYVIMCTYKCAHNYIQTRSMCTLPKWWCTLFLEKTLIERTCYILCVFYVQKCAHQKCAPFCAH